MVVGSNLSLRMRGRLQDHFSHTQFHQIQFSHEAPPSIKLGTIEQLRTIGTVELFISDLRHNLGTLQRYPRFREGQYLVAYVQTSLTEEGEIYTLYSRQHIMWLEQQKAAGHIKHLKWCMLEIPQEVREVIMGVVEVVDRPLSAEGEPAELGAVVVQQWPFNAQEVFRNLHHMVTTLLSSNPSGVI